MGEGGQENCGHFPLFETFLSQWLPLSKSFFLNFVHFCIEISKEFQVLKTSMRSMSTCFEP